jgi:formylglycine-generating enzyme required for sulfatase activity
VKWVSIEDSRVYATWAGKRLPHEWECNMRLSRLTKGSIHGVTIGMPGRCRSHGRTLSSLSDDAGFPAGAGPFDVMDLIGNVSQWTDGFRNDHTRAAIVRGGTAFQSRGSIWYFPQSYRLDQHQKYLR